MEYVIFDLEWDNVFYKKEKRFINQILQIGAVKLDGDFNITESFTATIRSAISKRVTGRFATLTGITTEKMLKGIPFEDAVRAFNKFSSNADVTMTWSDSDLYTIVENEKLLKDGLSFNMNRYLDLQKLVQAKMREKGYENQNQVSLEVAAEFFGISLDDFSMHTALDDSTVCGKLLGICYNENVFNSLVKDAKDPEFSRRLHFKSYSITDINDKALDKTKFCFKCPKCGAKLNRFSKWKYSNRWFSSTFRCPKCNDKYIARVFAKMTFEGVTYKQRLSKIEKKETENEVQSVPETV
ncbi:MAG: exonuclease domain-containing protein [Clostridia bacterium]|nr:exonuclease domain-containing protein [Clostridia bacterium]